MNRNFALEFVRVCEAAALSSARFMGKGDEKSRPCSCGSYAQFF